MQEATVGKIKFYAKHSNLSVSGGFETEKSRDFYIWISKSNNHPWEKCDKSAAEQCDCYQSHYVDDLLERYPSYKSRIV